LFLVYKKNGITVIEVLVAIGLISVISLISVRSSIQGFNTNKRVLDNTDYYHLLRTTFRQIDYDISLAMHSYSDTDYGEFIRLSTLKDSFYEYKEESFFIGDKDRLNFTSSSNKRMYKDSKESDIVEVFYYVDTDEKDIRINNLFKKKAIYINEKMNQNIKPNILLKNVENIEFKYLYKQEFNNEAKWYDRWNSLEGETKNKFPYGVKIKLKIKHPVKKTEFVEYTKLVKLLNPNNIENPNKNIEGF